MSRRSGAMFLVVALAAFLAFASTASAGVRGLTTTLETQKSFIGPSEDAVVRITYRNDAAEDLYLVRWQTALQGVEENLFDVRVDAQPVAYTGRLYKRANPTASDYIRIPAGGSLSADVELSSVYDLSRTGEYSIRYQASLQNGLRGNTAKSLAGFGGSLESNTVFLAAERNERAVDAIEKLAQIDEAARGAEKALTPSYVSCSSSRQSSLATALNNAQGLAQRSRDYLNAVPSTSGSTDTHYKTCVGAYPWSRWSEVTSDFVNIYSAMSTKTFTFHSD